MNHYWPFWGVVESIRRKGESGKGLEGILSSGLSFLCMYLPPDSAIFFGLSSCHLLQVPRPVSLATMKCELRAI